MSSYSFFSNNILRDGVMAGAGVLHSKAIDIRTMSGVAFQVSWTGNPTGVFIIEGSMDGTTFSDLGVGINNPAGAPGTILLNNVGLEFAYCRMTYTNTGGAGVLNIIGGAKRGL